MEHIFLSFKARDKSNTKGFTLLEVLIVIAIIGILVSIGLASYTTAQKKSRDARRKGDLKAMQSAWEQYYSQSTTASYPTTCSFATLTTYMPMGQPKDPQLNADYCVDGNLSATSYVFCALMESITAGNANSSGVYGAATTHYCVSNLQ